MIWLSSDLHLLHNRPFIYEARGFMNIEDMDNEIIKNFNEVIKPDDELYLLGDIFLGGPDSIEQGIELFNQIPGKIHLIWGNHDTDRRKEALTNCRNVVEICGYATILKYHKWHFYLSHFPTLTTNIDDYKKSPKERILNISGHTHSQLKFEPFGSYNVAVDAHNCYPVSINTIVNDFKNYFNSPIK